MREHSVPNIVWSDAEEMLVYEAALDGLYVRLTSSTRDKLPSLSGGGCRAVARKLLALAGENESLVEAVGELREEIESRGMLLAQALDWLASGSPPHAWTDWARGVRERIDRDPTEGGAS